ncbi:hypothetical protein CXG81DRAFT_28891 [Caulochytrium protostelioides]|uniref:Rho GDP-dissociation inhibitor n=1 Tax=Caulochytrium protostelioides TaxID=1555241 RepID=A0A4P9X0M4_9FUNG|nr:E set domain-containing protein [Caulochytrium protostelioides]RKO98273.1 hypothetical protein CXG81DRAFT_28891 [Caulochytrium protostelioides]|eukprot:RKO98273.1 hypothetical protein CXG81DRAFT_28891 [Caulochytrium protostelioides]
MSDEELTATQTAGYKPGEKKTVAELAQLDANDESLRKWKESLGLKSDAAPGAASGDSRKVIITSFALQVAGRPDVVLDVSTPAKVAELAKQNIVIKESVEYRLKVQFRIQNDVVSGLKYLQLVKRGPIRDRMEEMLGSYGPSPEPYEKRFLPEEAPSGLLARGTYYVKSKFVDDDGVVHLEWDWQFSIKKDWE